MVSGILTDFGLMYVAARLGAEWSLVVSHLGLKQAEIEQIQLDNPYKTINQISIALQKWRDRQKERADSTLLKQLFDALDETDYKSLWDEIEEKNKKGGEELDLYVLKVYKHGSSNFLFIQPSVYLSINIIFLYQLHAD